MNSQNLLIFVCNGKMTNKTCQEQRKKLKMDCMFAREMWVCSEDYLSPFSMMQLTQCPVDFSVKLEHPISISHVVAQKYTYITHIHKVQSKSKQNECEQATNLLLGMVTRSVSVSSLCNSVKRALCRPATSALHLHFSQQSQYAVGAVFFNLRKVLSNNSNIQNAVNICCGCHLCQPKKCFSN